MTWVLILALVALILLAIAFAAAPVLRAKAIKGRAVLIAAIALFLLGVGGGTYWIVGEPYLAWRAAEGVRTRDLNGLIALLIKRVRKAPDDLQAWVYLGRGYMGARDPAEAAKAYGRAVALAARDRQPSAALYSLYGEALVAAANGQVSDQAESAFRAALK
ncbi:MAG: tetratricopeptide repeat protein, partial [Rhizomicrobium sp.]